MNRMMPIDTGMLTMATRRQQRRDDEHHHDRGDQHEDVGEQLADRLLEALGQVVDVVGHPAQQIAPRGAVDVAERERLSLSSTSARSW